MIDVQTVAFLKKYVGESLEGAGALKGEQGNPGKSAYEIAQDNGFEGTLEERAFNNALEAQQQFHTSYTIRFGA